MNTTLPWPVTLRRHAITHRLFRNSLLTLLLVLPLFAAAGNGTNAHSPQGGFSAVHKQWCSFYPQLPFCPGAGTTVTARQAAPAGMGLVPSQWCALIPMLPGCPVSVDSTLTAVTDFGSNPGNLEMFKYVPQDLGTSPRPLVVALHGCAQGASDYNDETGWMKFADKFHFALLLPQQKLANHQARCFRWFNPNHNERDKGEALSIRQMIEKMKTDSSIDTKRIYVTGLSGGGAMTAVMLATYPDVFAGGGIVAGIPYKCANTETEAQNKCGVLFHRQMAPEKRNMTPAEWGALARRASTSTKPFPSIPISIWQGDADGTVDPQNETELMEQWTNILGIDQTAEVDEILNKTTAHPITHRVFANSSGRTLVETFLVKGMDHGTPIDPGTADEKCGTAAPFILNVGICSSFFIAKFWGLPE
jgi:poly(hydroxyalkanoate) depolymerase family esterase